MFLCHVLFYRPIVMKTTDSTIQLCKPLDVLNMCTKTIIFIIPMNELKKIVYVFH